MNVGDKIRELRIRKGLNPDQLAVKSGLSSIYIRKLESNVTRSITLETAKKLAVGLDLNVSDLIDNDDLPPPPHHTLEELTKEFQAYHNRFGVVEVPIVGTVPGPYPFTIDKTKKPAIIPRELLLGVEELHMSDVYVVEAGRDLFEDAGINKDDQLVIYPWERKIATGNLYLAEVDKNVTICKAQPDNSLLCLINKEKIYPKEEQVLGLIHAKIKVDILDARTSG